MRWQTVTLLFSDATAMNNELDDIHATLKDSIALSLCISYSFSVILISTVSTESLAQIIIDFSSWPGLFHSNLSCLSKNKSLRILDFICINKEFNF
ncbi:hypothetical protein HZS_8123 [Henneguya salminicola]|nr:hypothetical protein HZS_8123 [Henneguya salminicola]